MENNSSETTSAAAEPKKTPVARRSRRATAATGETVAAPAEAVAATPVAEPAEAAAPKKRATRTRASKASAVAAEAAAPTEASVPAETTGAADATASGSQPDGTTAPVKKRATRSRKKAAEGAAADAAVPAAAESVTDSAATTVSDAVDAAGSAVEASAAPATKKRQSRSRKKSADAEDTAQVQAAPEAETQASEKVAAPVEEAADTTAGAPAEKTQRTRSRNGQNRRSAANNPANNAETPAEQSADATAETEAANTDGKAGQQKSEDSKQTESQTRSNRTRQRERKRRGQSDDCEVELNEDDVLLPIAGILDVLDNYAFVRTSGYLPGTNDVYVSLGQVKKYDLRKGDAVVGAIRQPRENEGNGRQKYNAIVRVDSVNSRLTEEAQQRSDFATLTAITPETQLKLETSADAVAGRIIDAFAPIGRGQRAIVCGAAATGKTELLRSVAAAISAGSPDAHIMYVALDARPEEITELQRSINGEVIGSSFDRAVEDHTTAAELAVERAKRLVELGHDVVVFIDSVTRLGRAYVQQHNANSRAAQNGFDAAQVAPLKRLLAAARNIENGGSLTVIAAATDTSVSQIDERVREELESVWNTQIMLSAELARASMYPAINIADSFTRQTEQLVGAETVQTVSSVRRVIAEQSVLSAADTVRQALAQSASNVDFLALAQRKQGL